MSLLLALCLASSPSSHPPASQPTSGGPEADQEHQDRSFRQAEFRPAVPFAIPRRASVPILISPFALSHRRPVQSTCPANDRLYRHDDGPALFFPAPPRPSFCHAARGRGGPTETGAWKKPKLFLYLRHSGGGASGRQPLETPCPHIGPLP